MSPDIKYVFAVVVVSSRVSNLCGRTSQDMSCEIRSFLIPGTLIKVFEDSVVAVVPVVFTIGTTTTTVTTAHVTTATIRTTAITRTATTTGVTRTSSRSVIN